MFNERQLGRCINSHYLQEKLEQLETSERRTIEQCNIHMELLPFAVTISADFTKLNFFMRKRNGMQMYLSMYTPFKCHCYELCACVVCCVLCVLCVRVCVCVCACVLSSMICDVSVCVCVCGSVSVRTLYSINCTNLHSHERSFMAGWSVWFDTHTTPTRHPSPFSDSE